MNLKVKAVDGSFIIFFCVSFFFLKSSATEFFIESGRIYDGTAPPFGKPPAAKNTQKKMEVKTGNGLEISSSIFFFGLNIYFFNATGGCAAFTVFRFFFLV